VADLTGVTGSGGAPATHAGHDPELVASLLDRDLTDPDRAAAARQIAGCSTCAAIHRDLLVLASATRALPTPARTVEFRLTAADAARLREPLAAGARQTDEMQTTAAHASHDTILVASLADHSLAASDREAARAIVATCGLCAALHADTLALRSAIKAMPTPVRPRDYSLTPEVAARLRPGGWRRWVAAFGTSRDAFSRPLAVGLTTLGLAGLLVATLPSVLPTGSASSLSTVGGPVGVASDGAAPATGAIPEVGNGAGAPVAPGAAPSGGGYVTDLGAPSSGPVALGSAGQGTSGEVDRASAAPGQAETSSGSAKGAGPTNGTIGDVSASGAERTPGQGSPAIPPLILVSGVLLLVGLALFLSRWAARRFVA